MSHHYNEDPQREAAVLSTGPTTATGAPSSAVLPPNVDTEKSTSLALAAQSDNDQGHQEYPKINSIRAVVLVMITMCANILQSASAFGVTVAIANIAADLNIASADLQWLPTTVNLSFACTLLLFGRMADVYGHKFFFIGGCTLASIFSLAQGLSQTEIQLFVFRAITGAGYAW